jgi:hypothetical protein
MVIFLPLDPRLDPGSGMEKISGSGNRDEHLRSFSQFFGLKMLKFFDADLDPGFRVP